jgi:hypothetical protein
LLAVIALAALTAAATASVAAASPVAARPAARAAIATPGLHYAGQNCKTIHSQKNYTARICVITNADDALADQYDQALVTYTIKSGGIRKDTLKEIYLHACEGYCYNQNVRKNVSAGVKGGKKSAYISNSFALDPDDTVQAVAVDPCVYWTNGQSACWPGTHKDETISTY